MLKEARTNYVRPMPEAKQTFNSLVWSEPLLFVMQILNRVPYKYQAQVLNVIQRYRRLILKCGRQIGKTELLALIFLWWGFVRPKQTCTLVAPTQRQSKIPYERIRQFIDSQPLLASHRIKDTLTETSFDNQSSIRCYPAGRRGETIRGDPNNLLGFDEMAYIPDEVYTALSPSVAATQGTIIYSGSPYGETGKAFELWNADMEGIYKFFKLHIPSSLCPLITTEFLASEKETMTESSYQCEYEAEFISDADEFFPPSIIKKNLREYDYETTTEGDKIVGLDIARFGLDECAVTVLERLDNGSMYSWPRHKKLYKVMYRETKKKLSIPEAADWGREVMKDFNGRLLVVDATGLGAGVFDLLRSEFGDRLEAVNFSSPTRRAMYETLKIALEREVLVLNADDKKMIRQFTGFKLAKGNTGTGELTIKKSTTIHDDLIDALAMALWGYENGSKIAVMDTEMTEPRTPEEREPVGPLGAQLQAIEEVDKIDEEMLEREKERKMTPAEREAKRKKMMEESEFWGL